MQTCHLSQPLLGIYLELGLDLTFFIPFGNSMKSMGNLRTFIWLIFYNKFVILNKSHILTVEKIKNDKKNSIDKKVTESATSVVTCIREYQI